MNHQSRSFDDLDRVSGAPAVFDEPLVPSVVFVASALLNLLEVARGFSAGSPSGSTLHD